MGAHTTLSPKDTMPISRTGRRAVALLAIGGAALAAGSAGAVAATPDPERHSTTATGWHWYYGQTEAQVRQHYAADGDRIVDLEVESTSPYRFAVATMRNTGPHARGWYW